LFLSVGLFAFGYSHSANGAGKHAVNACGCYSLNNTCYCERGAKCGCPGNCEPKGCEEARQKQLEKEIAEEMKKAKEAEKAQEAAKQQQQAKPVEDEEESDTAQKQGAAGKGAKSQPAAKMTATQKKQLLKLIDVYLGDHPDAKKKALGDIREDLQ